MATPACPQCGQPISRDDINVAKDVAFCRPCNSTHQFSNLTHDTELDVPVDFHAPPEGAYFCLEGFETVVGGTHWPSWPYALGILAFSTIWNVVLSIFLAMEVYGTLHLLGLVGGPPLPGTNVLSMICIWIFLAPFLTLGVLMAIGTASIFWGRTEVRLGETVGTVFTGIGSIGWRRTFEVADIKRVGFERALWRDDEGAQTKTTTVVIEPYIGKPIKFGTSLPAERFTFVARVLRKLLNPKPTAASESNALPPSTTESIVDLEKP